MGHTKISGCQQRLKYKAQMLESYESNLLKPPTEWWKGEGAKEFVEKHRAKVAELRLELEQLYKREEADKLNQG